MIDPELILILLVNFTIAVVLFFVLVTIAGAIVRAIVIVRVRRAVAKRMAEMGDREAHLAASNRDNPDREAVAHDLERFIRDFDDGLPREMRH